MNQLIPKVNAIAGQQNKEKGLGEEMKLRGYEGGDCECEKCQPHKGGEEMNELLLTPEQRLHFESELCEVMSVCRVYPNEPVMNFADGLVTNICQAQHHKDTHPPKLDKPDGEGWWWFLEASYDKGIPCRVIGNDEDDFIIQPFGAGESIYLYKMRIGTWQRVLVLE